MEDREGSRRKEGEKGQHTWQHHGHIDASGSWGSGKAFTLGPVAASGKAGGRIYSTPQFHPKLSPSHSPKFNSELIFSVLQKNHRYLVVD